MPQLSTALKGHDCPVAMAAGTCRGYIADKYDRSAALSCWHKMKALTWVDVGQLPGPCWAAPPHALLTFALNADGVHSQSMIDLRIIAILKPAGGMRGAYHQVAGCRGPG